MIPPHKNKKSHKKMKSHKNDARLKIDAAFAGNSLDFSAQKYIQNKNKEKDYSKTHSGKR